MIKQLLLVYCKANEITAHEIERELGPAGFQFEHKVCEDSKADLQFNEQLKATTKPILLLLSDNYLKSVNPMHQVLSVFQELSRQRRLQCLIIDGWYPVNGTGAFERVPTTFDRIGQIIKYMNFWQEEYLHQRHQTRDTLPDDAGANEEQLKIIRGISTQIGEFLRYLRETDYWEYDRLKNNNFQTFFQVYGDESSFRAFIASRSDQDKSHSVSDKSNSIKEVAVVPPPIVENDLIEPENNILEEIPGLELLPKEEVSENGPAFDSPAKPSEALSEKPLRISPELTKPENLVEETLDSEPVKPRKEEKAATPEEKVKINFDQSLEEIIDEVAAEEADRKKSETVHPPVNKKKSYDILQSIFDDDEEEEENDIEEEIEQEVEIPDTTLLQANTVQDVEDQDKNQGQQEIEKFLELAIEAENKGDLLLAKSYYEKILSLNSELEAVNYKLGLISAAYYDKHPKLAVTYFKKTLELNPVNVEARYQYAMLLADKMGKQEKAIKHFKKTLAIEDKHPFANYDLALIYYKQNDLETAATYYEKAFMINPELKTKENDLAFRYNQPTTPEPLNTTVDNTIVETVEEIEEEIEEVEELKIPDIIAPIKKEYKTVLITGATSGIGRATAQVFAENGYRLILTGRRSDRLENLEQQLRESFEVPTLSLCFDVRQKEETQKALEQLIEDWGEVDILINNAGLAKGFAPIHEGDIDDWETMIDTNIKGLLYMTRAIAPKMVQRKSGHIINIASTAGKEVYPNGNVYCATKYAVDALTKAIRLDLYQHNIRVSQVAPGHVEETEFALVRFDGDAERAQIYNDFQPLKARDVAETIYFIASRPPHVNIQDVLMMGTQQASSNHVDRSGR